MDFGRGHGRNFDNLTMASWNFGHGNGQKCFMKKDSC